MSPGRFATAVVIFTAITLRSSAAWAQIDLSESWAARYHEDQEERIPGPEIGDFLGLLINEAARRWPCEIVEEIVGRPDGAVPHDLRGANPFLKEFAGKSGIPL